MSSPTTFLAALQNAVTSLNTVSQTASFLLGNQTTPAYSASIVVTTQAGWVASVQVIAAGSTPGYIYNCQSFSSATAPNILMELPNTMGWYQARCNFNNGMVASPGNSQTVSITYSLNPTQVQN